MIKSTLKLTLAIVLLASCKQKPAEVAVMKTPSGLEYTITHTNEKEKLVQHGQIVKLHFKYVLKSKDSILANTFEHIPQLIKIDTTQKSKYSVFEIMPKTRKGDKIEFKLSTDTLVKMGQLQFNEIFKKGDFINGTIEILNVFSSDNQSLIDEDLKKDLEIEKSKEIKIIKNYLAKNKINAIQTPEGVFVQIKKPGVESNKIDTTKQANVFYKGYLLNGETFDSNINPANPKAKPLEVRVGEGKVIQGWDIALKYFAKGGSGSIFIPAVLGYGPQPMSLTSIGYDNLAFDIEIADVIKKPVLKLQPPQMPAGVNVQPR
jgi:FKBP-type peptidyl-prolyl cis-trans isomerase